MVRFVWVALALALSACATTYQSSGFTGGFREKQLEEGIWRVGFGGNGFTTRETVQTYWLYRCAELAIEKGYDGFEILSNIQLTISLPPRQYSGIDGEILKTRTGGATPIYTPIYVPTYVDHSRKPSIEADIRFLKAPFEGMPPKVFDARLLKSQLDPHVNSDQKCDGNVCPHVHRYLFPAEKSKPSI